MINNMYTKSYLLRPGITKNSLTLLRSKANPKILTPLLNLSLLQQSLASNELNIILSKKTSRHTREQCVFDEGNMGVKEAWHGRLDLI